MATLRDIAKEQGLNVGYDDKTKNVTVGSQTFTPDQLKQMGGQLVNWNWTFNDPSKLQLNQVQTPQTLTSSAVMPQATPQVNTQTLASQLADAEKARTIASLKQAYDKTLGSIAQGEQSAIKGQEQVRSGIRTQATMDAKRFEDFLAQRGLSSSGVAPQGFIQQTGQTQSLLGQSQQAQQEALNRFGQQRAEAQGTYEFGQADAEAVARMTALQAQIDAQKLADDRAYQESLTASDRAYQESQQATEQSRSDFNNTIMANYNDLQAFANKLVNEGAEQWKIDAVLAARQQKIAEQGLDQQGRPIPVDTTPQLTSSSAALELWQQLGTANEAISRALGVPVGQRYVDATRTSGFSGGSTAGPTSNMTPKQVTNFVTDTLRGTSGSTSADMLVQLNNAGYFDTLTPSEIKTIMNKFGVDELMLEQAENRLTIPTQGITLPTGRTTYPTSGSGLSGMTSTIR